MDASNRKVIRAQSADFLKGIVEKSKRKEEPATPDYGLKDTAKIEKITENLKASHAAKPHVFYEKKPKP